MGDLAQREWFSLVVVLLGTKFEDEFVSKTKRIPVEYELVKMIHHDSANSDVSVYLI